MSEREIGHPHRAAEGARNDLADWDLQRVTPAIKIAAAERRKTFMMAPIPAPIGRAPSEPDVSPIDPVVLAMRITDMKFERIAEWLVKPPVTGSWALVFIRLMAGGVFLWEGIGKFYFPSLGVGRFTAIGLPMPELLSPAIAMLEIVGGVCLIAGILTRPVSILFIGEMIGVLLTTKVSLYLGQSPLPLPPAPPQLVSGPCSMTPGRTTHSS